MSGPSLEQTREMLLEVARDTEKDYDEHMRDIDQWLPEMCVGHARQVVATMATVILGREDADAIKMPLTHWMVTRTLCEKLGLQYTTITEQVDVEFDKFVADVKRKHDEQG